MADQQLQQRRVASDAVNVTPSDATVLAPTWGGLFVGGAGNVAVVTEEGTTLTFTGVLAGSVLPIVVTRVRATGTTATNIVGMM